MRKRNWPKRDLVKNYFPLPNEIFSLGLSSGELCVYCYLLYREDRKTYQCWPSYGTIGRAVGMSRNTVAKYVRGLEEKGLILTEPTTVTTRDGCKRNGNLCYTIRPIQEAIDYFNARQMVKLEAAVERRRVAKKLARNVVSPAQTTLCAGLRGEMASQPLIDEHARF